ncbi:MAG: hypothetical protein GY716_16055 [bacterium]|nr:hypothetical protein [bacterium]
MIVFTVLGLGLLLFLLGLASGLHLAARSGGRSIRHWAREAMMWRSRAGDYSWQVDVLSKALERACVESAYPTEPIDVDALLARTRAAKLDGSDLTE